MIDTESAQLIADLANDKLKQKYPLMGAHFKNWEVVYILEAYIKWWYLNHPEVKE